MPVAVDDTFLTDEDSALTDRPWPHRHPRDGGNTWPRHRTQPAASWSTPTALHLHPDADYHGPDSFTYT
ncbi:MAG: hypothetical protein IPN78_01840 [Candidatus Accumulibacter sp.]|nr:hypothetical protein [Candidatus Accumulibacter propinquus]